MGAWGCDATPPASERSRRGPPLPWVVARRAWEWGRLLRRQWPVLALILLIPALLAVNAPFLGPLLVAVYAAVGLLTWGVWRRWGWRAGRRLVWRRPRDGEAMARLRARPSARDLPAWRVLLMFLAPAAFGFLLANGLAGLLQWRYGVTLAFDTLGLFVLVAMAATTFLSVLVVPIAWIVKASRVRVVDVVDGRNAPLKPAFLVEHLTAASGITALAVLATSVQPDETIAPLLDMVLNTLTVAALALPGTLLATLLYVWHGLDDDVAKLEAWLDVRAVDSLFDLRRAAPAPPAAAPPLPAGEPADEPAAT